MKSDDLNELYRPLDARAKEIAGSLRDFKITVGYHNGHYRKNETGGYVLDYFPIPVISIDALCDLEIQFDHIGVTTKLDRTAALAFDFEKLSGHSFEAYGVEDYLADYCHAGSTMTELLQNISLSKEQEIGFSFQFPFDVEISKLLAFVELLRDEKFFY